VANLKPAGLDDALDASAGVCSLRGWLSAATRLFGCAVSIVSGLWARLSVLHDQTAREFLSDL
jgi:hypothetical protein